MFETLLVKPVFNLLEFIYGVIPGHDLGIAIILFTIIVRILMWPLVKRQLHHAKLMRKLQPELKKIKKAAKGDRQKEARLQMELYKERGIKPFSSIGTLIIQIPIFIALYQAVLKITSNPSSLIDFSYPFVRDLSWIRQIGENVALFDETLLGLVDLTKRGFEGGMPYLPAIILAFISSVVQYYQTKHMMSSTQDARKLSVILREAAEGKEADQAEVTAAVSRIMLVFLPVATFIFALYVPAALALYILTTSAVGLIQQRRVLQQDAEEMHEIADEEPAETLKKQKKRQSAAGKIETKVTISTIDEKPKPARKSKTSAKKKRRR
jgi:YidC/Oxa1 family membrane protein insertase